MPVRVAIVVVVLAAAASASSQSTPSAGSAKASSSQKLSSFDPQVNELLAQMTLEEKVGQITQADQEHLQDVRDIETYFLGSLLSGGSSDPKKSNQVQDWADMYDLYQSHALKTRLRIPLLYGVDAVHGHNNVIGAVIFPHNLGLGATRNARLVEEIGRITAKEVRATGINWTFAPCVAVVRDERWGRTYEGYGEDPKLVSELGEAAVRGLQGSDLADPLTVLACAKHFVGDGGTTWGTGLPDKNQPGGRYPLDQGDTRLTEEELRRVHLEGYRGALKAGVATIMPSYSSWNGVKASGSKRLLTEILKEELGFEGFLISDYNAIDQLPGDYRSDIKESLNAGMDMVMIGSPKYREFFTTLKSLAESGDVPMTRIDDAVRRILRVKFAKGLMVKDANVFADRSLLEGFGSAAHRSVARQAVRESIVLLKNENKRLPLQRGLKRIHLAGGNADDLGNQCGGWTIDWQGQSGPATIGTTVLSAVRQTARHSTVTYSVDGTGAAGADVGIVVVGETPYAEAAGDRRDLSLSEKDISAIRAVKQAGVPVVLVLISGRPMILGAALDLADAVVVAWLPGSEGIGVADVLFGEYKPTGKLPVSWPRSNDQLPINVGDAKYDPLFPFGFGLTYE
jgi:beta-glucosidase